MSEKEFEKPREFWINEFTGGASEAEESIDNGYHLHVIEYSAYRDMKMQMEEALAGRDHWWKTQKENADIQKKLEIAVGALENAFRALDYASMLAPLNEAIVTEKLRAKNILFKLREGKVEE